MRFVILIMVSFIALLSTKTQADSSQCPLTRLQSVRSTVYLNGPDYKPKLNYDFYEKSVNKCLQRDGLYSRTPEGLLTFGITTKQILPRKRFIVIVDASLYEQIALARIGTRLVSVSVWDDSVCEIVDNDHVGASITDCINTITNAFESDYHKDNRPSALIPNPLPIATPTPAKSSK